MNKSNIMISINPKNVNTNIYLIKLKYNNNYFIHVS